VGVARQAAALAAAGLVEKLKAESEKKREHELDKPTFKGSKCPYRFFGIEGTADHEESSPSASQTSR
jgi:hypothetical protein